MGHDWQGQAHEVARPTIPKRDRKAHLSVAQHGKKWLKAPGDVVPKYQGVKPDGKLTAFEPSLHQALTTDSHRPKQARRSGRALFAQMQAHGYVERLARGSIPV